MQERLLRSNLTVCKFDYTKRSPTRTGKGKCSQRVQHQCSAGGPSVVASIILIAMATTECLVELSKGNSVTLYLYTCGSFKMLYNNNNNNNYVYIPPISDRNRAV
eukprot:sb/3478019/